MLFSISQSQLHNWKPTNWRHIITKDKKKHFSLPTLEHYSSKLHSLFKFIYQSYVFYLLSYLFSSVIILIFEITCLYDP